ncbi:MAG: hypothetical protein Q8P24_02040 [Desulfobacterales bacterium]|nr:hypothetical protein [Desulfobacterales bacterium]
MTWDGLDEIEIDFTNKLGLVAFAGENGTSKTGVLENMHHFPQLVSRDGALWAHVTGRDAEKEFESDFMGHHYRSLIKMDAGQGKQEGYLWVDGKPMVNGKITAYKEFVNSVFGQPFTYFRSQFCPQKSKKTNDMQIENMTTGVFRELLREFLNLQRYAAWEDGAKQAGNVLQGKVGGLEGRIEQLQIAIDDGDRLEGLVDFERCNLEATEEVKSNITASLAEKRQSVDTLKEAINKNALALQRKADIQQQIDRLTADLEKERAAATSEIYDLSQKWQKLKDDIRNVEVVLQSREAIEQAAVKARDLENSLVVIQGEIDARTAKSGEQGEKLKGMDARLVTLNQRLKDLDNDPENLRLGKIIEEAERAVKDKLYEIRALDGNRELTAIESQIETAKTLATALDARDPNCTSEACSFIVGAIKAADDMLPLAKRRGEITEEIESKKTALAQDIMAIKERAVSVIEEKAARVRAIDKERKAAQQAIIALDQDIRNVKQNLSDLATLITTKRQALVTDRAEAARLKTLAEKLGEIQVAEARKADLEKQLAEVAEQGKSRRGAWDEKEKDIGGRIFAQNSLLKAITIDEEADAALLAAQAEIKEIETIKLPEIEKEIQGAREKIATLQAELRKIEAAEKELEEVKAERDALTLKISRWRYLQFGCGKTGLQNIRIGGAAPTIVYNANRLLVGAYSNKYSINLVTQDEEGKEVLDIKILLPNGQEVFLDDISGGQRVWCVQSLWLAMSLLNQEGGGRKFNYFCSDESDGALDLDNAEKFTALYRPFMTEAKLGQLFFISHKASCRAAADNTLNFEHGKNPSWT